MKNTTILVTIAILLTACSNEPAPSMQSKAPTASTSPAASSAPDENAALGAIRKTTEAQATYFKVNRRYALTFDELVEARLLSSEPTAAQTGYDFKLRPAADAQSYKLSVVPTDATRTGIRYFFTDQSAVIHAETGKEASSDSPAIQ